MTHEAQQEGKVLAGQAAAVEAAVAAEAPALPEAQMSRWHGCRIGPGCGFDWYLKGIREPGAACAVGHACAHYGLLYGSVGGVCLIPLVSTRCICCDAAQLRGWR